MNSQPCFIVLNLCVKKKKTYRLDKDSLDTQLLTLCLHLLRRLNAVKVVDGNVGAFFGKRRAKQFTEATERLLATRLVMMRQNQLTPIPR